MDFSRKIQTKISKTYGRKNSRHRSKHRNCHPNVPDADPITALTRGGGQSAQPLRGLSYHTGGNFAMKTTDVFMIALAVSALYWEGTLRHIVLACVAIYAVSRVLQKRK